MLFRSSARTSNDAATEGIESINFFVEKIEVEEVEEDVEHKENIKEITNIIAVALTEESRE